MKSDYIHKIENFSGRDVLVIEDLDLGGKSVTNNMEEVLDEIEVMEKINTKAFMIVYRDSDGVFDGFDACSSRFIPLRQDHWKEAVKRYIERQVSSAIVY